jgi:predicted TIM-barrel fold metal-dependent hydrolase
LATDIAAITFLFDRDYPFPKAQAFFRTLVDAVEAERIMWATDWPWTEGNARYRQCLRFVTHECRFLNDRQRELILAENAVDFLNIQAT